MAKDKTTKKPAINPKKTTTQVTVPSVNQKVVWLFDNVDMDGDFAFNPDKIDSDANVILEKIIYYSSMTWSEVTKQTHDGGKSKHHFLDYKGLSESAKSRLFAKRISDDRWEQIFSFALNNKLRIVGLRENEKFHVLWYDPNHEVYPMKEK